LATPNFESWLQMYMRLGRRSVEREGGTGCSPNFYIGEQPIHFAPQYLHSEYPNFQVNY